MELPSTKNTSDHRCDLCANARLMTCKIQWHECTLGVEKFNECVKSGCSLHFKKKKSSKPKTNIE